MNCSLNLFTSIFAENESVTCTTYKMVHKMADRRKLFTGGNFIKECMMEAENDLCPEKAALLGTICLSSGSVVQRTWRSHSATDTQKAGNFLWYYLVLDEYTDISSNLWCSFVVLIRTFRSHTICYPFAACTKQQPEGICSWKCRKLSNAITFS